MKELYSRYFMRCRTIWRGFSKRRMPLSGYDPLSVVSTSDVAEAASTVDSDLAAGSPCGNEKEQISSEASRLSHQPPTRETSWAILQRPASSVYAPALGRRSHTEQESHVSRSLRTSGYTSKSIMELSTSSPHAAFMSSEDGQVDHGKYNGLECAIFNKAT
jgi:hypothetical protein